jgi:AcrR family transcriptional regulator
MQNKPSTSPPVPRIERTQQALLHSLMDLIVEQGYDRTTVEDILRRADVGRTAFYSHFENKQDLLLNRFSTIPWIRRGPDGALDATFLFGHLADERELVTALRTSPAFDNAIATLQQTLLVTFTQLLQDEPATRYSELDRQLTAQALTGALMQLVLWWIESGMPESPATMANWFRQFATRITKNRDGLTPRTPDRASSPSP